MSSYADHNERMVATLKARIEKLEAALRGIIGWLEDPEGGSHEEDMREASRIARAAFLAMLRAWEGMQHDNYVIVLPLPAEASDD